MYEKRFLWGVEGVSDEGRGEVGLLLGGVWALVPSLGCVIDGFLVEFSGERTGGVD
jgi:hypothetical protein